MNKTPNFLLRRPEMVTQMIGMGASLTGLFCAENSPQRLAAGATFLAAAVGGIFTLVREGAEDFQPRHPAPPAATPDMQ